MKDGVLPAKAAVDALHIAAAVWRGRRLSPDWNFKRLANTTARARLETACRVRAYEPCIICTARETSGSEAMAQDEIIREVRAIREAYAARFGFDVRALYEDAKQREGQGGRRVIAPRPRRVEPPASPSRPGRTACLAEPRGGG